MDKNIHILVVDDFPTMRRIARNLLHEAGYTHVTQAEDGAPALAMAKTGTVDLVITDWNMPGMSGLELLKGIRAEPQCAAVPPSSAVKNVTH